MNLGNADSLPPRAPAAAPLAAAAVSNWSPPPDPPRPARRWSEDNSVDSKQGPDTVRARMEARPSPNPARPAALLSDPLTAVRGSP
eukprot:2513240-Rhodomonas_salina.1